MGRTQQYLADTVSKELDLPLRIGRRFLKRIMDLVSDGIVYTGRMEIRGLGTFAVTTRPAHTITHPATGQPIPLPEKKTVHYRTSRSLRRRLNPPRPVRKAKPKGKRKPRKS
ncbi:MAG: HU family DNA-binding protein [Armatimonadetes bacterium]|nr:HU family DNA-binding protein [Armatimonadota bacterium]